MMEGKMDGHCDGHGKVESRVHDIQVTRGHNIVVDGWAGALNPHPQLKSPHSHTQNASKTLALFDSCSRTNGPTERQTNRLKMLAGAARNKAGYTATHVACGWAGAIF